MKTVVMEKATLNGCVKDSRSERVVITRNGRPVALLVNVRGMDVEQLELSTSPKFWKLIAGRRQEKTVDRAALERLISKKRRET